MMKLWMLLAALVAPALLAAQDSPLLTLDRGQAYEFSWDAQGTRWVTRLYVTVDAALSRKTIRVGLRSVAQGSRTDPRLTGMFHVVSLRGDPSLTSFDVVVAKDAAVLPGTYQATLVVDAEKQQQALNVQLTIPPGALAGPAALQLNRVLYTPFAVDNPQLAVWETSGKSPADLVTRQAEPFAGAEAQYGGQILVDPAELVPAGSARLRYALGGHFPLGTVSAKITLSAPQASTPLVIPVQVHTRLTRAALVLLIVLGLALGYFTRIVLKSRIEIAEARSRAIDAEVALAAADNGRDAEFRRRMAAARATLRRAIEAQNATVASLSLAITAASDARAKALEDLKARLHAAETLINALADAVTPAWVLPTAVGETLAASKREVADATRLLDEIDAVGALSTVRQALEKLRVALIGTVAQWRRGVDALLRGFDDVQTLIEADRRTPSAVGRNSLDEVLTRATLQPDADAAGLATVLQAVHRASAMLVSFEALAAGDVRSTFDAMDGALGHVALPKPADWTAARESTTTLVHAIEALGIEPGPAWNRIQEAAVQLRGQWRGALTAQKPAVDGMFAAFDAGAYRAAAQDLAAALMTDVAGTAAAAGAGGGSGDVGAAGAALGRDLARQIRVHGIVSMDSFDDATTGGPTLGPGAPEPSDVRAAAPRLPEPVPFAVFVASTMKQLMAARFLQTLTSAIALSIVGYLIFADTFVGTSGDLLSAFFWGFTTDIGIDALLSAAKVRQPG